ncbi:MAG: hypothetical protein AB8I08_11350 [Sandaracinaceae bacterium]
MDIDSSMWATSVETFEMMCFLVADPATDEAAQDSTFERHAGVRFDGPSGQGPYAGAQLVVEASGFSLTEALELMVDREGDEEAMAEAMAELANIIGGRLMGDIDPDTAYDITPIRYDATPEDRGHRCLGEATLCFDEGSVRVSLLRAA